MILKKVVVGGGRAEVKWLAVGSTISVRTSKRLGVYVGSCPRADGVDLMPQLRSRRDADQVNGSFGRDDIVEETLYYFRANVLYRNYQIEGPADRTLIYLTFFVQQCLKELEKHPFKKEDQFKAYMRQCREELAKRLGNRVYQEDGSRNKHWMLFSKRKFMGKEMI